MYKHRLDERKWEEIKDGIRHEGQKEGPGKEWTYESKEDYRKARKQSGVNQNGDGWGGDGANNLKHEQKANRSKPRAKPPEINMNIGGLGLVGYILIVVFIIGLAFLIYYLYLNSDKDGTKINNELELTDVDPTKIELSELQRLLQEALSKSNYRGAIRIYFIFIVRDLAEKNWIKWEKEKTNFHYLREMSGKKEFDDFNVLVSYFEIIWYGKRELDKSKFEQIQANFTEFLEKLGVE